MEEQEKKDILNDYVNNKLTVDELAFKYHMDTNALYRFLKNVGVFVSRRYPRLTPEARESLYLDYLTGKYSRKELMNKYNCSNTTILRVIKSRTEIITENKSNSDVNKIKISHTYLNEYRDKFTIGQKVKTESGKGIIKERNKDNFLVQFKNYAESFTLWQLWKANYSVGGAE